MGHIHEQQHESVCDHSADLYDGSGHFDDSCRPDDLDASTCWIGLIRLAEFVFAVAFLSVPILLFFVGLALVTA